MRNPSWFFAPCGTWTDSKGIVGWGFLVLLSLDVCDLILFRFLLLWHQVFGSCELEAHLLNLVQDFGSLSTGGFLKHPSYICLCLCIHTQSFELHPSHIFINCLLLNAICMNCAIYNKLNFELRNELFGFYVY